MSSSAVFDSLREVFPQVDIRILKAASIEHANDADAAVEFVLHEVLPSLGMSSETSCAVHEAGLMKEPLSSEVVVSQPDFVLRYEQQVQTVNTNFHPASKSVERVNGSVDADVNPVHFESVPAEVVSGYSQSSSADSKESESLNFNKVGGESMPTLLSMSDLIDGRADLTSDLNRCHWYESSADASPSNASAEKMLGSVMSKDRHGEHSLGEFVPFCEFVAQLHTNRNGNGDLLDNAEQMNGLDLKETASVQGNGIAAASTSSLDIMPLGKEDGSGVMVDLNEEYRDATDEFEELVLRCLAKNTADLRTHESEKLSGYDCGQTTIVTTCSSHFSNIDFLEDFITDAKSGKIKLCSAVELVANLVKEVEHAQEQAKQATEEASTTGGDIFATVEELKQMVDHAKEANNMHAGEVFGEKSILATEARELQSRLLRLSDEKNKHLAIIEEMRRALEARLNAAEEEIRVAEKEKLEKEALAKKALEEQELLVNAVVEESKKLQQVAEENSRLRDFLVERGRTVDALQGEMEVICEDVLLLKERVDGRLPLTRSLRSTLFCLTSSQSSSSHGNVSSLEGETPAAEPAEKPSVSEKQSYMGQQRLSSSNSTNAEACDAGDREESLEDGWEFCGNDAWSAV